MYYVNIERAVYEIRPADIASDAEPVPISGNGRGMVGNGEGMVKAISGGTLTIITDDGKLVTATLADKDIILKDGVRMTPADIGKGSLINSRDRVTYHYGYGKNGKDGKRTFEISKQLSGKQKISSVGAFTGQDTANRVAKAFVHAMVLCHKDDKPSLF